MTDEMDVDFTVVDNPDHVGPNRISRGYIERDSTPYYGGVSECMARYLEHGYSYVERPSGGEILYGFRSREGDYRRTPLAMIVRLEGGKGEPLEGRVWLDSQRVVEVSSLESDAEPEPDRLASISPDWYRNRAPLEAAREMWERLELPAVSSLEAGPEASGDGSMMAADTELDEPDRRLSPSRGTGEGGD